MRCLHPASHGVQLGAQRRPLPCAQCSSSDHYRQVLDGGFGSIDFVKVYDDALIARWERVDPTPERRHAAPTPGHAR